jgi:hypothetical protein
MKNVLLNFWKQDLFISELVDFLHKSILLVLKSQV